MLATYDEQMLPAVEKAQAVLQTFLTRVTLSSLFDESAAEQALTCHVHALLLQTTTTLESALTDTLSEHRAVATLVGSLEVKTTTHHKFYLLPSSVCIFCSLMRASFNHLPSFF